MSQASVFFVGQPGEVAHHAAPFQSRLNVQIVEPHEVLQKSSPGDLAIFYSEHFDRFRDACQRLKQQNVATLYMIDGILEWRNAWENRRDEVACPYTMRPVLAHKVACIGNSQARVLESWGNQGKTEVIGIPRLDGYPNRFHRRAIRSPGVSSSGDDRQISRFTQHNFCDTAKPAACTAKNPTCATRRTESVARLSLSGD